MVYQRTINIRTLTKLDTSSKESFIEGLMYYESVPREVAQSWAEHGMYELCEEKTRNCPVCDNQLKTWRAKLCLKCGAKFESWIKNE